MGNRKNKRGKKPRTPKKKQTDVEMEVAEEQFLEDVTNREVSDVMAEEEQNQVEEGQRNGGRRTE